uniref:FAR1 domain-containing protein n=1 Tax=Anisakis simplex TaxID=6269 RepID=A0A0M3JNN9_ANISI
LVEDNKQEREFSTLTKAKYDELKVKFEQSSSALIEKGKDCVTTQRRNRGNQSRSINEMWKYHKYVVCVWK